MCYSSIDLEDEVLPHIAAEFGLELRSGTLHQEAIVTEEETRKLDLTQQQMAKSDDTQKSEGGDALRTNDVDFEVEGSCAKQFVEITAHSKSNESIDCLKKLVTGNLWKGYME